MNRPFVFINIAMTADGKIDTFERRGSAISSSRDKERVDQLRASADAVMVGGKTLLDEDPKLTVKSGSVAGGTCGARAFAKSDQGGRGHTGKNQCRFSSFSIQARQTS